LIEKLDINDDGEVSYDEFRKYYHYIFEHGEIDYDYRAIFNLIDKKKTGIVSASDLTGALTTSGKITTKEAEMIMQVADADHDGKIDFKDFSEVMKKNQILCWKLLSMFRVVFVIGGPASGKGTLCELLVKTAPVKILHLSSGDLLREEITSKTVLGNKIAETMKKGELCDASVVIALLKKQLVRSPGVIVLLDGFPRSLDNAKDFVRQIGHAECLLFFDCPHEVMINRIIERGKTSNRLDDNYHTALERIKTFESQSKEPMEYFKKLGSKVHHFDATLPKEENIKRLLQLDIFSTASQE